LAGADGAAGEAERHPADGRSAETRPAVWSRQAAGVGGSGPGGRMFRCRRGRAPSAPGRTAAGRVRRRRCRRPGTLRATATGDDGVRSVAHAGRCTMTQHMVQLQEATIKAQCKQLRMPVMAAQFSSVAEQAVREKKSHIGYLEALLAAELEERERNTIARRIKDAHLPRIKTLEEFDYAQSPNVSVAKMREIKLFQRLDPGQMRSEEHTSELQSP